MNREQQESFKQNVAQVTDGLLPCPFCGGTDIRTVQLDEHDWTTTCWNCCAQAPSYQRSQMDYASESESNWNQRAPLLAKSEPSAVGMDETGWLIERCNAKYYFAGWREEHNGMGFCWYPALETSDHLQALRFARKEDAERMIKQIGSYCYGYTAVEHAWITNPAAPAQAAPAEQAVVKESLTTNLIPAAAWRQAILDVDCTCNYVDWIENRARELARDGKADAQQGKENA